MKLSKSYIEQKNKVFHINIRFKKTFNILFLSEIGVIEPQFESLK